MLGFSVLCFVVLFGYFPAALSDEGLEKPTYKVAILAYRDKCITQQRWQPLGRYLNQALPQLDFQLEVYHLAELEQAVAEQSVDFVFTQPAHYVLMTYRTGLSSPLASLINLEGAYATEYFGGVIFTRAHRDDIVTLADLKGQKLAAAATTSLGAFQMQAFELLQNGVSATRDMTLIETGQPQKNAVNAVLNGQADVGFVRTGVLEALVANEQLDISKLKLLNAQHLPGFPFVTSTRLYPEWPFAAMPKTNKDVARQVAAALLAIPSKSELAKSMAIAGFTISGDYRTIDNLMRALRLEPFNDFEFNLKELINWWFYELMLAALLIAVMIGVFFAVLIQRQRQLKREGKRLSEALEQVRLLGQAVEQSPESIVMTDRLGRMIYLNTAFEAVTGYQREEVLGKNPRVLQSGQTPQAVYKELWQSLNDGQVWQGMLSNKRKNGEVYPSRAMISPVKNEAGQTTHFLAIQHDASEHQKKDQRIQQLLYVDQVTAIANRNKLVENMDQVIEQLSDIPCQGCLVLINLSRFKFINQLHGVEVGDGVLKIVAQRLQLAFGQNGLVARLSADEFAVFCENRARFVEVSDWVKMMGQRALGALEKPIELKGETFKLDLGVGVAPLMCNTEQQSSAEAINQVFSYAGLALKEARQAGLHGLKIFNEQLLADSRLE